MLILTCSYDDVAGLYYLRARRYDTTVGRFTQEDTYLGDGRNLYVYVQNNPLKYVDPSGYDKNEKIGNGFLILISGIGMAVTGTVTAIVATSLAVTATVVAAPALAVAGTIIMVATAAMGAGMAVMGVSDVTQGTVEIYNAVTGNSDLAPNLIRDTIFGGDQEAYNQAEALISFGATAGLAVTSVMPLVITTSTSGAINYYANINTSGSGSKSGSEGGTVPKGTLIGKLDGLTADERGMIEDLLSSGKNVEIIPRSNTSKTPDFFVDGVKTELKTLNGSSLNTPVTRIEDGFEQGAEVVIIDGRKTGLTLEQASTVIERALGKYDGELPGIVEIWTKEGILRR